MIDLIKYITTKKTYSKVMNIFILALGAFALSGQEAYEYHSISSPTASNIIAADYFPMDYYTGRANINVPLYAIESKGMNMPVSLSYNSGGVRVNDPNGWVGQNWNLNVGGVITRQVNGKPDDQALGITPNIDDQTWDFDLLFNSYFNLVLFNNPNWPTFNESNNDTQEELEGLASLKYFAGLESEPDIFSFNFMGYSGKFFLGNDGEWKVISDSNIKVELNILDENNWTESLYPNVPNTVREYADVLYGFVLIDGYGNKYTFGFDKDAIEFSLPFFKQYDEKSHWIANSWNLTKVENVNNEVLFNLDYERGYYVAHLAPNESIKIEYCKQNGVWTDFPVPIEYGATGYLVSPSYLKEISTFEEIEVVTFNSVDSDQLNYDFDNDFIQWQAQNVFFPYLQNYAYNQFAYPSNNTSTDPFAGLKWRKLDNINVQRNSINFRNIALEYNDNPNERLFLESLSIKENAGSTANASNSLNYAFDYKNYSLPPFLSKKVDHFGYATGTDYDTYQSYIFNPLHYESREPVFQTTGNGSLTKITYPTGGYTDLTYELNTYSYLVSNDRQSILDDLSNPITCGLRIKEMEMYDDPSSSTPSSSKEIFYQKQYSPSNPSGRSSGVLSLKPKYVWIDYLEPTTGYPEGGYKSKIYSNNNLTPLGNMFESHIGYDEVTEVFSNGSYITYKYDTHRLIKDELPYLSFELNDYSPYAKFTDKSFLRGKQIDKSIYDNSGQLLERETFDRREDIRDGTAILSYDITTDVIASQKCFKDGFGPDYVYNGSARKIYYYKDYIQKKTTEYFRGGYLKKTEDFVNDIITQNSNEYKYLSSKTIWSGTDSRTIDYTYPKDHSSMNEMVQKHMTNVPISQSINSGAGGGSKLEYYIGAVIVPQKFYAQRDDGSWKEVQELKYDDFNDTYPDHVKENTKPADFDLFWGSGGEIGLIDQIKYEERTWDKGYNNVRQLTSIIDHNDIESTFDYDGLGRLTLKNTNNGKLKNIYTYQYGLFFNSENILSDDYSGLDGTGFKTEILFDGLGREETNTKIGYLDGGSNLVISTTYDNIGRVKTINDPTIGGLSTNIYENSPLSVLEKFKPAGSPKEVEYLHQIEENNFVVETKDEDGITTKVFTDIFGRKTKTADGMGFETKYNYNLRDQVNWINPPGGGPNSRYAYQYYADGLLKSKSIPDKGMYQYIYDQYDNIDEETLANQKVIKYNYHSTYNDFLMSKTMDGTVLEEYLPYTDYYQDFIGEEKYSIHTDFGVVGQRHEILNTAMDMNFGRPTDQHITTLDGEYTLELKYDDMGNMISKTTTVDAFDISRQSKESWYTPKGIRVKATGFVSNSLVGDSQLNYNGHDWLESRRLADGLQTIAYGYNPRGWLSSINGTSSISGFGSDPCAETPDIPIPDLDCDKLSEIIQTFIVKYNCQDLNDGTPTNLEIQINAQSFNNYEQTGVNSESIILPLNGESGNSNSSLDQSVDFDINNVDDIANIASGIYNVLLDCISQNPDLLSNLEQLISESLDNSTTYTENNHATSGTNQGGIKTNAPFFGMNIYHYSGNEKLLAKERYNGNISWIKWQVYGDIPHAYGFDYDDNNRLLQAIYGEQEEKDNCAIVKTDRYSVPIIGYDELGNIQQLHRRGLLNPEASQGYEYGFIDKLEYSYEGGSPNLVTSITDDGGEIDKGFVGSSAAYSYSSTGNMTSMPNKSLGFLYAFNDLPVRMTTDKGKIINYYTSTGLKLKSVLEAHPGGVGFHSVVTNYFDTHEFINSKLRSIYFGDGRATILKDEEYIEYYLKDHLGNTRVRIADRDGDKKVYYNVNDPENDELMSSHHYYPFGMEWDTPHFDSNGNSLLPLGVKSKYTYNGKEFVDDLDINLHDYGFRYYDPAMARFTTIDPLAESYDYQSGFAYAVNNPILYRDELGLGCADCRHSGKEDNSIIDMQGYRGLTSNASDWPPDSGSAGDFHFDSDGSFVHDGNGWVNMFNGNYVLSTPTISASRSSVNSEGKSSGIGISIQAIMNTISSPGYPTAETGLGLVIHRFASSFNSPYYGMGQMDNPTRLRGFGRSFASNSTVMSGLKYLRYGGITAAYTGLAASGYSTLRGDQSVGWFIGDAVATRVGFMGLPGLGVYGLYQGNKWLYTGKETENKRLVKLRGFR